MCTCKEAKSILADESFSVKSLTPLAAVGIKLDRKVTHYPKRKVCPRENTKFDHFKKLFFSPDDFRSDIALGLVLEQ